VQRKEGYFELIAVGRGDIGVAYDEVAANKEAKHNVDFLKVLSLNLLDSNYYEKIRQ